MDEAAGAVDPAKGKGADETPTSLAGSLTQDILAGRASVDELKQERQARAEGTWGTTSALDQRARKLFELGVTLNEDEDDEEDAELEKSPTVGQNESSKEPLVDNTSGNDQKHFDNTQFAVDSSESEDDFESITLSEGFGLPPPPGSVQSPFAALAACPPPSALAPNLLGDWGSKAAPAAPPPTSGLQNLAAIAPMAQWAPPSGFPGMIMPPPRPMSGMYCNRRNMQTPVIPSPLPSLGSRGNGRIGHGSAGPSTPQGGFSLLDSRGSDPMLGGLAAQQPPPPPSQRNVLETGLGTVNEDTALRNSQNLVPAQPLSAVEDNSNGVSDINLNTENSSSRQGQITASMEAVSRQVGPALSNAVVYAAAAAPNLVKQPSLEMKVMVPAKVQRQQGKTRLGEHLAAITITPSAATKDSTREESGPSLDKIAAQGASQSLDTTLEYMDFLRSVGQQ